jgi:hypothetical protein
MAPSMGPDGGLVSCSAIDNGVLATLIPERLSFLDRLTKFKLHTDFYRRSFPMSDTLGAPEKSHTDEHKEKYFSFQIKGWTNFDPMDKSLAAIAAHIEQGNGILTLVEVTKIEQDLAGIGDEEVRECFANILAAKRLVRTVNELPQNLLRELRSALKTEEEVAPKKPVASVPNLSENDASGKTARQWP